MIAEDAIPVADALRAALDVAVAKSPGRLVVAASGGRDSMALMHAIARWFPASVAAVATFDHGSGAAATDAAALVAAEARRLGLTVIRERARAIAPTEDAWRTARWAFLKRVARGYKASVATAHTRDDQLETIVLRLLRGTGARGLAALAAPTNIVRPWLPLSRTEVASWALAERVPYVDDPTNFTRQYFRSRVRLDLLPALEGVHPGFGEAMLGIGERAAALRREIDVFVDSLQPFAAPTGSYPGAQRVTVQALHLFDDAGLTVIWPALLAKVGVALNQRGTTALVRFTNHSKPGARLELSGGASVVRLRGVDAELFELRAPSTHIVLAEARRAPAGATTALPNRFASWRFEPLALAEASAEQRMVERNEQVQNPWVMPVPANSTLEVRNWQHGDRIRTPGFPAGRRVARYLSEARIPSIDRRHWPVVIMGEEILWVPGVCRSLAAPNWPGWPDVTWYRCERELG
ncbi:MAG: tRNA lysidine(34) synthetase TilS [Gemmatimonadaceae bacterium]